jgi:predicted DNA-binding transcriptional regulator AlpA
MANQRANGPVIADQMLKIPEVAARLGRSRSWVYARLAEGTFGRHNIGTAKKPATRISESALAAYLESKEVDEPTRRARGRAA